MAQAQLHCSVLMYQHAAVVNGCDVTGFCQVALYNG
jgi:hypothetical protein